MMANTNDKKHEKHLLFRNPSEKIRGLSLNLWEWIKKNPNGFLTLLLAIFTFMLALGTFDMARYTKRLAQSNNESVDYTRQLVQDNRDLVESNLNLVDYTRQANVRAEKLFIGQNKPLIDVTPIGIVQVERKDEKKTKMCATLFSVVNYSGFKAYNIAYDIKYGSDWISEWVKADDNRKEKAKKKAEDNRKEKVEKRVIINHLYISRPKVLIPKLMPGETKGRDFKWPPGASGELDFKWPPLASGEFDLEVHVVDKNESFPVLVRVTWENESGHVFDEIHKYKLLCTESGPGLSFTFIPEGVISQKNMESRTGLYNSGH